MPCALRSGAHRPLPPESKQDRAYLTTAACGCVSHAPPANSRKTSLPTWPTWATYLSRLECWEHDPHRADLVRLVHALHIPSKERLPVTHEIELPADMAFLAQLMERAEAGLVTYLTHQGRRIGVVVPADVVDTIRHVLLEPEDDLVLSEAESDRRFHQLAQEQGVEPVRDLAELRGPGMDEEEFRGFYEAVVSGCGERER
jgi:hypothetical protein